VGASSGLFLDEAREHYARLVTGAGYRQLARIRGTQLGEAAGVIGAAHLIVMLEKWEATSKGSVTG